VSYRATNGAAIRALRQALGMRQQACAAHAGISAPYLANIEAGRRQPPLVVASRLAEALGVPLDAITYPPSLPVTNHRRRDVDGDRHTDRHPYRPTPYLSHP
jgi:transcriptional regulator with XRE-family HTH domain